MVCEKCTKKLSKLATVHVDRNKPGGSKLTNENKLLSSKQKFKATTGAFKRCRICKQMCHHISAHYCQNCAYQKGICAMCGRKVADTAMTRNELV